MLDSVNFWKCVTRFFRSSRTPRRGRAVSSPRLEVLEQRLTPSLDGVTVLSSIVAVPAAPTVASLAAQISGAPGRLEALIDFNHDGTWDRATELVGAARVGPGNNLVPLALAPGTAPGKAVLRVQFVPDGSFDTQVRDQVVAVLNGRAGGLRVTDQLPAGGGTYWLGVQSGALLLRTAGGTTLFRAPLTTVAALNVRGTAAGEQLLLDLRGVPAGGRGITIYLDGKGGANRATIWCAAGAATATLGPSASTVVGRRYAAHLTHFSTVQANANHSSGTNVTLYGAAGADVAVVTPTYASLRNRAARVFEKAVGFARATTVARSGHDTASLYGTDGDDRAVSTHAYAYLRNTAAGVFEKAVGFARTTTISRSGHDTAWLYDGRGNDRVVLRPGLGQVTDQGGTQQAVIGFASLNAIAAFGGGDNAVLHDGPGADRFRGSGSWGTLESPSGHGQLGHWQLNVSRFDRVQLLGSHGGLNIVSVGSLSYAFGASGFVLGSTLAFDAPLPRDQALSWIHTMALQIDPALARASGWNLALALRDHIHQWFVLGSNSDSWPSADAYERYREAILTGEMPVLCGGAQFLYTDLLEAFGLRARYVGLFAANGVDSHASVEAWLGGRWVVMDPTFDVAFVNARGRYLSYAELQAGVHYRIKRDGKVSRPNLLLEHYYISLRALLYRITYPPTLPN